MVDLPAVKKVKGERERTAPTGIERYLGSGMVKGIGPVYAGKLVKAFGMAVFDIIEPPPLRLPETPGIGFLSADTISQKIGIVKDLPLRAQAGISQPPV